jgi:amino acid adenylation domain-containing protein
MSLIHDYLADSARRSPHSTAIVDGPRTVSYAELDERSTLVASRLVELGLEVGDRVGIFLPKSIEAVVGLYGAMKAGGAYVPIDPSSPASRAVYMASNCGIRHLISHSSKRETWSGFAEAGVEHVIDMGEPTVVNVEGSRVHSRDWLNSATPLSLPRLIDQDLAYILYTSGSTGDPKGVMLTHRNCLAFVEWAAEEFEVTQGDRLSSHAPFHFDLSTFDLYAAAIAGASVHLVPKSASMFPLEVRRFIEDHGITVWYSVPSILTLMVEKAGLEAGDLQSLRTLLFAGEVFPTKYLSRLMSLLPHVTFANLYGPTETNVCTAYTLDRPPDENDPPISIGRPISNVATIVVSESDEVVPSGAVGELLVRGPTVMAGYWGDATRTAQRLTPSPVLSHLGDRVYRTGDLVEEMEDGNYRFLGRRDDQIKSRGYRIELGDIEAALSKHQHVVEVAVVAIPDDLVSNRIVGFAVTSGEVSEKELLRFCATAVPAYMVPETMTIAPSLPKTSTGKIDRQALATAIQAR